MSENTKVLHLVSTHGNWEPFVSIVALSAALREQGVSSVVAAPELSLLKEMADASGVETIEYSPERTINPFRWKELAALIKKTGASIVHVHDIDTAVLMARAHMFAYECKVVVTRYDTTAPIASAEYGGGVNAAICPSETLAKLYVDRGADKNKIHVIRSGINLAATDRALEEQEVIRAYYREHFCPAKEKPRFLVNVAPLDERGGQKTIIDAMPDVLEALPQAHLFLMGEGAYREELQRQCKLHAVSGDVSFIEPDKSYHRLLAAADLYVTWGTDDVSGFMVESAMAGCCCIIARDSGCYREILEDGKCGDIVKDEPKQENPLKDPLVAILKNRHRREQLGKHGRIIAAQRHSASAQAAKVADVYKTILEKK